MPSGNALRNVYFALEDRYYDLADALDAHVPFYKYFVEPIEQRRVPSFPVFALLIAALFTGAYFLLTPAQGYGALTVNVLAGEEATNASVELYIGDKLLDSAVADKGIANFKDVPLGKRLRVVARKAGFDPESRELVLEDASKTVKIRFGTTQPPQKAARLSVLLLSGETEQPVPGATVSFDGVEFRTGADGVAIYEGDDPGKQLRIEAKAKGFKNAARSAYVSQGTLKITLKPIPSAGTGTSTTDVTVSVSNASGDALSASVALINADTRTQVASARTSGGMARLGEVPLGIDAYVKVQSTGYLTYDGKAKNDVQTIARNARFNVVLARAVKGVVGPNGTVIIGPNGTAIGGNTGTIAVNLIDEKSAPVSGAKVSLYSATTGTLLQAYTSDKSGAVLADVEGKGAYYVTAYKSGYLPASELGLAAGANVTLVLKKVVAGSAGTVTVKVSDADGNAVSNARVELFDKDGFAVGVPDAITNAAGSAKFEGVPLKHGDVALSVRAVATKGALSGTSDLFVMQEKLEIAVVLKPSVGTLSVKVVDFATSAGIADAAVNATDAAGAQAAGCIANASGQCGMQLRADQEFSIAATKQGYLDGGADAIKLEKGKTKNLTITLIPAALVNAVNITFNGLYDETGARVTGVTAGRRYMARFNLTIPSGFNSSGVFIRVGGDGSVADDTAGILADEILSSSADILASVSYNPSSSCESDIKNSDLEGGLAKWVQFTYPKGFAAFKELAIPLRVKTSAADKSKIEISFRSWGEKGGKFFRSPEDAAFGDREKTDSLDSCYAASDSRKFTATIGELTCENDACISLLLEQGGARLAVPEVAVDTDFTTNFEITYDGESLAAPYVRVSAPYPLKGTTPVRFGKYLIAGKSGDAGSNDFKVLMPAISGVAQINGTANATAQRVANAEINVEFGNTGGVGEIATAIAPLSITGTQQFVLAAVPTALPFSDDVSTLEVHVNDASSIPVTDASLKLVYKDLDGNIVFTSSLDGDAQEGTGEGGIYTFELTPNVIGDVTITAKRDGFASKSITVPVGGPTDFISLDKDLLTFSSSDIGDETKTQSFLLSNELDAAIKLTATITYLDTGVVCGTCAIEIGGKVLPADGMEIAAKKNVHIYYLPTKTDNLVVTFAASVIKRPSVIATPVSITIKVILAPTVTPTVTPTATPSAPLNPVASAGDKIIDLSWDEPLSPGSSAITNYRIYRGTTSGGEAFLVELSDALSYTDTGLTNDQKYYYRVSAKNTAGEGPKSKEVKATPSALGALTEPQDLGATAGDKKVALSWKPPSYVGSPVTKYLVYRNAVHVGNVASTTMAFTDAGLTNGQTYNYGVSALNAIGEGPKATTSATPSSTGSTGDGCKIDTPTPIGTGTWGNFFVTYTPGPARFGSTDPDIKVYCSSSSSTPFTPAHDCGAAESTEDRCQITSYSCSGPHTITSTNIRTKKTCQYPVDGGASIGCGVSVGAGTTAGTTINYPVTVKYTSAYPPSSIQVKATCKDASGNADPEQTITLGCSPLSYTCSGNIGCPAARPNLYVVHDAGTVYCTGQSGAVVPPVAATGCEFDRTGTDKSVLNIDWTGSEWHCDEWAKPDKDNGLTFTADTLFPADSLRIKITGAPSQPYPAVTGDCFDFVQKSTASPYEFLGTVKGADVSGSKSTCKLKVKGNGIDKTSADGQVKISCSSCGAGKEITLPLKISDATPAASSPTHLPAISLAPNNLYFRTWRAAEETLTKPFFVISNVQTGGNQISIGHLTSADCTPLNLNGISIGSSNPINVNPFAEATNALLINTKVGAALLKFPAKIDAKTECKLTKEGGDAATLTLTPDVATGTLTAQLFDALSNVLSSDKLSDGTTPVNWLTCAENYCTQKAAAAALTDLKAKAELAYKQSVGKSSAATTFTVADQKWKDVFGASTKRFTFTTVMRLTDGVELDCNYYASPTTTTPSKLKGRGAYIVQYRRETFDTTTNLVCSAYPLTLGTGTTPTASDKYIYAKVPTPTTAPPVLATGPSLWSLNQIFVKNDKSPADASVREVYTKCEKSPAVSGDTACNDIISAMEVQAADGSHPATASSPEINVFKTNWDYRVWRSKIACIACGWNWDWPGAVTQYSAIACPWGFKTKPSDAYCKYDHNCCSMSWCPTYISKVAVEPECNDPPAEVSHLDIISPPTIPKEFRVSSNEITGQPSATTFSYLEEQARQRLPLKIAAEGGDKGGIEFKLDSASKKLYVGILDLFKYESGEFKTASPLELAKKTAGYITHGSGPDALPVSSYAPNPTITPEPAHLVITSKEITGDVPIPPPIITPSSCTGHLELASEGGASGFSWIDSAGKPLCFTPDCASASNPCSGSTDPDCTASACKVGDTVSAVLYVKAVGGCVDSGTVKLTVWEDITGLDAWVIPVTHTLIPSNRMEDGEVRSFKASFTTAAETWAHTSIYGYYMEGKINDEDTKELNDAMCVPLLPLCADYPPRLKCSAA